MYNRILVKPKVIVLSRLILKIVDPIPDDLGIWLTLVDVNILFYEYFKVYEGLLSYLHGLCNACMLINCALVI